MDPSQLNLLFGWAAILSAVATLLTLITGILFLSAGGLFGPINDAASVIQMLVMLPVAAALYLLTRHDVSALALLAAAIGVAGMLIAAVLQALLVFRVVEYEQTAAVTLSAGGAVGLWLILANLLALAAGALPGGLVLTGVVAGAGYVLLVIGFRLGGQGHPLFYAGSGLAVIGYTVWGTWLGFLFLSGGLAVA
jgi:hypothetical protein